jgi:hypothetical protein
VYIIGPGACLGIDPCILEVPIRPVVRWKLAVAVGGRAAFAADTAHKGADSSVYSYLQG